MTSVQRSASVAPVMHNSQGKWASPTTRTQVGGAHPTIRDRWAPSRGEVAAELLFALGEGFGAGACFGDGTRELGQPVQRDAGGAGGGIALRRGGVAVEHAVDAALGGPAQDHPEREKVDDQERG